MVTLEDIVRRRKAIAQMHKDDQALSLVELYRTVLLQISQSGEDPKSLAAVALGERTTLEHTKSAIQSLVAGMASGTISFGEAVEILKALMQELP